MNSPNAVSSQPSSLALTEYLTRSDLASYLRLGASTLAKLSMRGEGPPSIRVGKSVRYRRADADAWMAAKMEAGRQ